MIKSVNFVESIKWENVDSRINILVGKNKTGKTKLLTNIYTSFVPRVCKIYLIHNPLNFDIPATLKQIQMLKTISKFDNFKNVTQQHISTQVALLEYNLHKDLKEPSNFLQEIILSKLNLDLSKINNVKHLNLTGGQLRFLEILLTVFNIEQSACVILIDDIELGLDIHTKNELIKILTTLKPYAQFIVTTHSPSIFGEGWGDKVVFMEDIII